jgi:VWFA-related protein
MSKSLTATFRLALSLLVLTPVTASAQTREAPAFEGLVEVSEVLIDVLATGEDGRVVLGLGKDDFIVEEDGWPVELTSVSYYTTRYGDEAAGGGEVPSSRYLVLFFHDTILQGHFDLRSIRQQLDASRQSMDWVETELRGSDWVAVVSYDHRLKVHQDFTQDKDAILYALEMAISRKDPDKDARPRPPPSSGRPSLLRRLPEGRELGRGSRSIYDALRLVADASGHVVGRKNLLLFTFGFAPGSSLRHAREYDAMEASLNDHNVAVYPIHLGGVGAGQPHGWFLAGLAEDTGGVYYENFRRFTQPLAEIGEDNYGYYVLSYPSEHPAGEIGYERVEVRARDESIRIRARRGYRYGL